MRRSIIVLDWSEHSDNADLVLWESDGVIVWDIVMQAWYQLHWSFYAEDEEKYFPGTGMNDLPEEINEHESLLLPGKS